MWTGLCPVSPGDKPPEGVTVSPVLAVPAEWRGTWATHRIRELLRQFASGQDSQVSPDFQAGDLAAPFDVALTGSRKGDDQRAAARVVVLGVSAGLTDGYLNQRVMVQDRRGTLRLTDAPSSNADLVVNSAYWLVGREQLIAAGPAKVQPVAMIPPRTLSVLWAVVVLGLPSFVVAGGALVMLARRH